MRRRDFTPIYAQYMQYGLSSQEVDEILSQYGPVETMAPDEAVMYMGEHLQQYGGEAPRMQGINPAMWMQMMGGQQRQLQTSRPFSPKEMVGGRTPSPEDWMEGYIARGGATQWQAGSYIEAWRGVPGPSPGHILMSQNIGEFRGQLKGAKRSQQMRGAYETPWEIYDPSGAPMMQQAAIPTAPGMRLERGVVAPMAYTLGETLPIGMQMLPPGTIGSVARRSARSFFVPEGRDIGEFVAPGTEWTAGMQVQPFEGAAPMDLGLGRSADWVRFMQGMAYPAERQLPSGEIQKGTQVRMLFEIGATAETARLATSAGANKYTVTQGTVPGFEGMGVSPIKDITGLPFQYWQAHPEEAAQALGMTSQQYAGQSWQQVGYQLTEKFRQDVLPQIYDPERNALVGDWFIQPHQTWGVRRGFVPPRELQTLAEMQPEVYQNIMQESAGRRQMYGGLIGAAMATSGEFQTPTGAVTPSDVEINALVAGARQTAMAAAGVSDVSKLEGWELERHIITAAAEKWGGAPINLGGGVISAPATSIQRFSAEGYFEGDEASKLGRAFSNVLLARGGPQEELQAALGRFSEEQSALASSGEVWKRFQGAETRRVIGEQIIGSKNLPANMLTVSTEAMLKARGVYGTERGEAFERQWRESSLAFKETGYSGGLPRGLIYGEPSPGSFAFEQASMILHPEVARMMGVQGAGGQRMAMSTKMAEALGRDFDKDLAYLLTLSEEESLGMKTLTEKQVGEFARRAVEQYGRNPMVGKSVVTPKPGQTNLEALQEALDPRNLYQAGEQDVVGMMGAWHRSGQIIGPYFNVLEDIQEVAKSTGGFPAAETMFQSVHGRTQGRAQLPPDLQQAMDVITSFSAKGAVAHGGVEGPTEWAFPRGAGVLGARSAVFEALAGGKTLSPETIASMMAPGEQQRRALALTVEQFRGARAGLERAPIAERASTIMGPAEDWVRGAPMGGTVGAHLLRRAEKRGMTAADIGINDPGAVQYLQRLQTQFQGRRAALSKSQATPIAERVAGLEAIGSPVRGLLPEAQARQGAIEEATGIQAQAAEPMPSSAGEEWMGAPEESGWLGPADPPAPPLPTPPAPPAAPPAPPSGGGDDDRSRRILESILGVKPEEMRTAMGRLQQHLPTWAAQEQPVSQFTRYLTQQQNVLQRGMRQYGWRGDLPQETMDLLAGVGEMLQDPRMQQLAGAQERMQAEKIQGWVQKGQGAAVLGELDARSVEHFTDAIKTGTERLRELAPAVETITRKVREGGRPSGLETAMLKEAKGWTQYIGRGVRAGVAPTDIEEQLALSQQMEMAMSGPPPEAAGGTMEAIASGARRMLVGWTPFQMRRMWQMTAGPIFSQMIPAAAQAESAGWQAAQAAGMPGGGIPEGVAGGVMQYQAAQRQAMIAGGRAGYRAWGAGIMPVMEGAREAQGIFGPALGAAGMAGIGAYALGAGAASLPIAAAVGAPLAAVGTYNYLASFGEPTAENALRMWQPGAQAIGGTGLSQVGQEGWFRQFWRGGVSATGGFLRQGFQQPFSLSNWARAWREAPGFSNRQERMAMRLAGTPMGQMGVQDRMAALNRAAELGGYEGTVWAGMDEGQRLQALSQFAPYVYEMSDLTPGQLLGRMQGGGRGGDWWVSEAIAAGISPTQYEGLAGQLQMGPTGASWLTQQALAQPGAFERRAWTGAMQQYAPLTRFGFTPEQIGGLAEGGQLTGQQAVQYQRLLSGDRYAWSALARAGQAPAWAQTTEAGGLQIGTTTLSGLMTPSFGFGIGTQAPLALWNQGGGVAQIGGGQTVQLQYGGAWGVQDIMSAEQRRYQDWQAQRQMSQPVTGAQYQAQRWGIQDTQQAFEDTWQRTQFGFQREALQLSDRQFWERMALQEQRLGVQTGQAEEDLLTQYQRGMTRLGWTEQDLITRTDRQRTQYGWQAADIARQYGQQQVQFGWQEQAMAAQAARATTRYGWNVADVATAWQRQQQQFGWQRQDIATGWAQQQTQFGWAAEDLARQRATSSLQFGWQQEDFEENIRFATGRARQRLLTQQERSVVMRNIAVGGMQTEEERMEERERWATEEHQTTLERLEEREQQAEEDHEKQLERLNEQREWQVEDQELAQEQFEERKQWYEEGHETQLERLQERRQWLEEDFDEQESRIETRRRWLEEDYNRDKERMEERESWAEEELELQKKHHIEDMDLSTRRHEATRTHFEESIQYREQLKELDREKWTEDIKRSMQALSAAEEHRKVLRDIEDLQKEISRRQQEQIAEFNEKWVEGRPFQAVFENLLKNFEGVTSWLGISP